MPASPRAGLFPFACGLGSASASKDELDMGGTISIAGDSIQDSMFSPPASSASRTTSDLGQRR